MATITFQSLRVLLILTILTGIVYPALVTGVAQLLFAQEANGSLIRDKSGAIAGSSLLGQQFSEPKYLWSRLSSTSPYTYNAGASCGSNLGPTNKKLMESIEGRVKQVKEADSTVDTLPPDLVTSSGSGLDPHISPESAKAQVNRVSKARGVGSAEVQKIIDRYTLRRQFELLGEPTVNVLLVNLALDGRI